MSAGLRSLRELFPLPFVGVVLLLVVLILVTPSLLSTGAPSAGSLQTQAELIIDRTVQDNVTHFYVRGLGIVRFASMSIALATNLTWPVVGLPTYGPPSWENLTLGLTTLTSANPVAVNISATYVDAQGASVRYVGAYAFYVTAGTLQTAVLLSTESAVGPTPIDSLPLTLLLPQASTGGGS